MYTVLITGASGMVGKGILLECLEHERISKIILISRTPNGLKHAKIQEIILPDFTNFQSIQHQIPPCNAVFHCMGVSAAGLSEATYTTLTYSTTKSLVDTLYAVNPTIVFNYVSGMGTDSSEQSKSMWARVKGKTENYALNKGFNKVFLFRPGFIVPEKGIQSRTKLYRIIYVLFTPFLPLFKKSKSTTTTTSIGKAMIQTLFTNQQQGVLGGPQINQLAAELN